METLHRYTPLERLSPEEAGLRRAKVREKLRETAPEASGLLVFSRVNIYYLTGTMACGLYWLPLEGEGALLVRKGRERACMESPLAYIAPYRSFREVIGLLGEAGCPPGEVAAVEMGGLPWDMANLLQSRMCGIRFVPGDAALRLARAVKTQCELLLIREAGQRHGEALGVRLPKAISPGMTEREIARRCVDIMLDLGHGGLMRMSAPGEEIFYGHVAADDSGNYPHYYNGPMGFRGEHPALPCLGGNTIWRQEAPLTVDMGFCHNGYVTDKTQCFWGGRRRPCRMRPAPPLNCAARYRAARRKSSVRERRLPQSGATRWRVRRKRRSRTDSWGWEKMLFPSSDTASALPSTNIPPLPKGLTCRWKRAWSSRWSRRSAFPDSAWWEWKIPLK